MGLDHPAAWLVTGAEVIAWCVIGMGLLQNGLYLWQLTLAWRALRRHGPSAEPSQLWRRYAETAPPISLLAPAYNEEKTIVESVRSLLALHYPSFEVVIVNDGSTDDTLKVLTEAFELEPLQRDYELIVPHAAIRALYGAPNQPRLVVVDKDNGGKADALNAGLNLSRSLIICSMDADSLLEPDALLRAVRPFIDDPERVVAVGGTIRVANGCDIEGGRVTRIGAPRNALALLQTVEYLRAFLMARLAWSEASCLLIISGAFGLFRRDAVMRVGGYSLGTVGEDMELVVKLHRYFRGEKLPYRISFMPEPVCWTQAPEDIVGLGRQRARWHRGALETFSAHRDMLFNPRYGRVGFVGFGYMLLIDVLGPFVEIAGYLLVPSLWLLGLLDTDYLYAFLAISFAYGVLISVAALALEESLLRRFPDVNTLMRLMLAAVAENFGYRQLNNIWRLRGAWEFLTRQQRWGTMTRLGFNRAGAPSPAP